jgi:hypothetical protein
MTAIQPELAVLDADSVTGLKPGAQGSAASVSASDVVTLRGGLTLPLAAIRLTFELENRGLQLLVDAGGDVLIVGPSSD